MSVLGQLPTVHVARSTTDCHSDSLRVEITDVDISGQRNELWDDEEVSPLRSKRNDLVIPAPYVPPFLRSRLRSGAGRRVAMALACRLRPRDTHALTHTSRKASRDAFHEHEARSVLAFFALAALTPVSPRSTPLLSALQTSSDAQLRAKRHRMIIAWS